MTDIQAERAAAATASKDDSELDIELDAEELQESAESDEDEESMDGSAAGDTDGEMEDSDDDETPGVNDVRSPSKNQVQTEPERQASIADLRARLHARITSMKRGRGGASALANGDGQEGEGSVAGTKDELLEERRRKRGEMRDRRRRERKEARRAAANGGKEVKAKTEGQQGKGKGRGADTGTTKAPTLLVPEGSSRSKHGDAAGVSAGGSATGPESLAFSTVSFGQTGSTDLGKKKSKHALPSNPKAALAVLAARKAKEEKKRASGGAQDDGDSSKDQSARWDKALAAAEGVKIRDDEALLKKAAKKHDKLKEKSKKAWWVLPFILVRICVTASETLHSAAKNWPKT